VARWGFQEGLAAAKLFAPSLYARGRDATAGTVAPAVLRPRTHASVYAIISDRGRQATVREGDVLMCDQHPDHEPGNSVTFDQVLLTSDEGTVRVGKPTLEGVKVTGEVVGPHRGQKLVVFRFKRRKNVRVKRGHRQHYTRVKITQIEG